MKNIYLIQPNEMQEFQGKKIFWLPYTSGVLWAYALQFPEVSNNYCLQDLMFHREKISSVVDRVLPNSIFAFSCYIWNWEYNKKLAQAIKERYPDSYIVFGGPQVSDRPLETDFFKKHKYVDTIVLGEGEESFTRLLIDYVDGKKTKIYNSKRLENVNTPSPYQVGVFDKIIADNPEFHWNGVLETNRGCPFACTFCDWGGLTYSKVKQLPIDRVDHDIEWFGINQIEYIAVADANFGIFKDRDLKIAKKITDVRLKYGYPANLNINFNKNQTSDIVNIVKVLAESGLNRGLTISFQSLDDDVLEAIKRKNMAISKSEEIFRLLEESNLTHYSEVICPLPLETYDTWRAGLIKLITAGQHQCIDAFFTAVLENSEMNQPEYRRKYDIKSIEREYIFFFHFGAEDVLTEEATEKINLIVSTSTMSLDDHIRSWMYTWLITNFHIYGWTQIYARFLNAHNIKYDVFYDCLLDEIANQRMGFLSEQYLEVKRMITLLLTEGSNLKDVGLSPDVIRFSQRYFHRNRKLVEQLLADYVKTQFDPENFVNLHRYQINFVSHMDQGESRHEVLDLGIKDTITKGVPYQENLKECTVAPVGTYSSQEEFLAKTIMHRRNGFGKNLILDKE